MIAIEDESQEIDNWDDPQAALIRIEKKIEDVDAKLTAVLASVEEIISQAKPALDQVMSSPLLAMLTGSGGKKNGRS